MAASTIASGAATGAAVGSVVPGVGTITGAAIGAGASLIGSYLSYLGMNKQIDLYKQQMADTKEMFGQQRADAKYQFDTTTEQQNRQFNKNYGLQKDQLSNQFQLSNRGLDLQEKSLNAQISENSLARKDANETKKENNRLMFLSNLTKFMNTPQGRAAQQSLFRY